MQHTIKYEENNKHPRNRQATTNKTIQPIQYTSKHPQHAKTHAAQSNINEPIKPMQHKTKYQQNAITHATHNQISTNR